MRIKSTETNAEQELTCDGVFEYVGLKPSTTPFEGLGILNDYGYVVVNEHMETSIPGVYGAGDVVTKDLRQVVTACADGAIAAQRASKYVESFEA